MKILSPSVHEAVISRHFAKDTDDPVLQSLFDAVKTARELATKAQSTTDAVLKNEMRTIASRHRDARAAGFGLLETATKLLDQALQGAKHEIAGIDAKTKGPAPAKDIITVTQQRELRERLASLPEERRKGIVASAIANDDQLLIGAVFNSDAWLSGLTDNEMSVHRHNWRQKHFSGDIDRRERLSKALDAAEKAGALAVAYVDHLTDADLVAKAESMEKQATAALAAVK
jgi:hypothetical protein